MTNPIFIKLEIEQITTERLERLKQQLTLIALEQDLLVFRVDKPPIRSHVDYTQYHNKYKGDK